MKRMTLFLLLVSFGFSQMIDLTLERAEKLALEQNFDLSIAREGETKAKVSVAEAVGIVLPSINAYGSYTKNHELPVIYIPDFSNPAGPNIPITMGVPYNATAGLSLNQPLFNGGAAGNGLLIALEAKNISSYSREMTRQQVLNTVRSLYYQTEFLESLIEATERSSLSAKTNLEQVQKREAVGKASRFDLLQAQVKLQSLQPQLQSLKNQHETVLTHLRMVMGIEEPVQLNITDSLHKVTNPFAGASLDSLKTIGLMNRPEMRITESQQDIAKYQRNIAMGQVLPSISLSADVRHQAQAEHSRDIERDLYMRSTTTALNLSWPLFSGGRKALGIQKAVIAKKEADIRLQQTTLSIKSEIEAAWLKVNETEMNIEANATMMEQAAEALRLARIMYANGSSTQLEVLTAEGNYLQAQSSYYQTIFQYNVAVDQLKKAVNAL
ncbi:MAG: TolC family protein [Candidatus Marinimicrobia bacterium]|nr:TolC family protein [Candidatus Neomarinimicrobiota bacterium]